MTTQQSSAHAEAPVTAARKKSALFGSKAGEHARQGCLSEPALAGLKEANLFGLMAPAELGGLEASPRDTLEAFEEVSRADGSTGWVLTTCAFATGLAGVYLSDSAAAEVFGRG